MLSKEQVILIDALIADFEGLKENILTKDDLFVNLYIPDNNSRLCSPINICISEILLMNTDIWYFAREKNKFGKDNFINPKLLYENSQKSLLFLKNRFNNIEDIVSYEKYICLDYAWYEDDNWFDDYEIQSFVEEGFKEIDILLINAAYRRDRKKVAELLESGANPLIAPEDIDYCSGSYVLDAMSSIDSYHFTCHYEPILSKLLENKEKNEIEDLHRIVKNLYSSASASVMFDLITSACKIEYSTITHKYIKMK